MIERYVQAVGVTLLFSAQVASAQVVVDTCGQQLQGDGMLVADLDCTGQPQPWVRFMTGGALFLNGFTLSGEVRGGVGIIEIVGPGTITGPLNGVANGGDGIRSQVSVYGANISGNEDNGIIVTGGGVRAIAEVFDSTISNNGITGIFSRGYSVCPSITCYRFGFVDLESSVVSGNGRSGVVGDHVTIRDSEVSGNGTNGVDVDRFVHRRLKIRDSEIADNVEAGVFLRGNGAKTVIKDSIISGSPLGIDDNGANKGKSKVKLSGTTVAGNDDGIEAFGQFKIAGGAVTGNTFRGIVGEGEKPVAVKAASITGNGTSIDCGVTEVCADLDTNLAPKIKSGATCDTSHVLDSGIPGASWGVCALD